MSTSTPTTSQSPSPSDPSLGQSAGPSASAGVSKQSRAVGEKAADKPTDKMGEAYRPLDHEERIWKRWMDAKAFHADPQRVLSGEAEPYAIVIPPPNVTDRLHLGHALNNTLQDILIRTHRMRGFETLWMPGTDHAGIATQAVVEKRLRASGELKGALRESMTRDEFVARTQAFKDEYEAVILGQLQRMGCSCDWDRTRFTMDEVCVKAVREAFFILFRDGLIYRGKRLVNWDPALQTAVADDECFDEEIDGAFYYLRYPLVHKGEAAKQRGSEAGEDAQPVTWNELARRGYPGAEAQEGESPAWITVATTRPETYLGDTAVAINPHDPRAKALRGLFVELPMVGRVIPILEDSYVVLPEHYARNDEERADPKAKMATGFLKVTPAHDPNDYELGQRHKAAIEASGNPVLINIFAPDATISDKHGWSDEVETRGAHKFLGKSREEARKLVVAEFKSHGLLEGIKPHRHSVKHSDRSKAVIEPYLSDQWYVRVTDARMAASANEALAAEQRTGKGAWTLAPFYGPDDDASLIESKMQLAGEAATRLFYAFGHRVEITIRRSDAASQWLEFTPPAQVKMDEIVALMDATATPLGDDPAAVRLAIKRLSFEVPDVEELRKAISGFHRLFESSPGSMAGFKRTDSGDLRFYPARYAKTYEQWHDNIRDWCISRQLWWGHRVPVWRCVDRAKAAQATQEQLQVLMFHWDRDARLAYNHGPDAPRDFADKTFCVRDPEGQDREVVILLESLGFAQDSDVLDTWFSSGLWPMSTMHWPDNSPLLQAFNPTSTLCTAREIITLWVSRMVMFNRYLRGMGNGEWAMGEEKPSAPPSPSAPLPTAHSPLPGSGPLPFHDVFIHAVIQDGFGQKMSKSLGNGVDPLDIISSHGADAMRFTLCQMTTQTQDVRMPVDMVCPHTGEVFTPRFITNKHGDQVAAPIQESPKDKLKKMVSVYGVASGEAKPTAEMPLAKSTSAKFDLGKKFANKLWNASKFAMGIVQKRDGETEKRGDGVEEVEGGGPSSSDTSSLRLSGTSSLLDRWMLSRLAAAIGEVDASLKGYEFSAYATTLYDLLWRDFCDWYLEGVKPTIAADPGQQAVLLKTLESILRLLHPVMPFVTETIWETVRELPRPAVAGVSLSQQDRGTLLATGGWPTADPSLRNPEIEAAFERLRSLVTTIRDVRSQHQVVPRRKVTLHIGNGLALDAEGRALLSTFANLEQITTDAPPAGSVAFSFDGRQLHLSNLRDAAAAGAADDTEKSRLTKLTGDLKKSIATLEGRLGNPGYTDKAPPHMVQQTRDQLNKAKADLAAAEEALRKLGGGA